MPYKCFYSGLNFDPQMDNEASGSQGHMVKVSESGVMASIKTINLVQPTMVDKSSIIEGSSSKGFRCRYNECGRMYTTAHHLKVSFMRWDGRFGCGYEIRVWLCDSRVVMRFTCGWDIWVWFGEGCFGATGLWVGDGDIDMSGIYACCWEMSVNGRLGCGWEFGIYIYEWDICMLRDGCEKATGLTCGWKLRI